VAEAERITAVITVPAAGAAGSSLLKKTSSRCWALTVRSRRNVIAGDLNVGTRASADRWPLEKPPIGPGSQ